MSPAAAAALVPAIPPGTAPAWPSIAVFSSVTPPRSVQLQAPSFTPRRPYCGMVESVSVCTCTSSAYAETKWDSDSHSRCRRMSHVGCCPTLQDRANNHTQPQMQHRKGGNTLNDCGFWQRGAHQKAWYGCGRCNLPRFKSQTTPLLCQHSIFDATRCSTSQITVALQAILPVHSRARPLKQQQQPRLPRVR